MTNGEIDLYGVYVPPVLAALGLALVAAALLRRGMMRFNLYRFVWHQALFDAALLLILVGAFTALLNRLGSS
ncbi:DUF1656 domain-containing protein [Acidocella sp.]|uniref:DUF1656 domain-containing protein n=1 Tax=Acidocella sp. TaxID=50710 RepID=UPI002622371A|nr:DUF1656 domain-containing protein [Acidocella sp.]